jgi:hypothetical protein
LKYQMPVPKRTSYSSLEQSVGRVKRSVPVSNGVPILTGTSLRVFTRPALIFLSKKSLIIDQGSRSYDASPLDRSVRITTLAVTYIDNTTAAANAYNP